MSKKLTSLIYIASPFSSKLIYPLNKIHEYIRYRRVTKMIGKLQDTFPYAFIGPITQSYHTKKFSKSKCGQFKSWEIVDLTFISKCDELWVIEMDGWEESTGVQAEIKFAKKRKIPVSYIDFK